MVFQPLSPIRQFHPRESVRKPKSPQVAVSEQILTISTEEPAEDTASLEAAVQEQTTDTLQDYREPLTNMSDQQQVISPPQGVADLPVIIPATTSDGMSDCQVITISAPQDSVDTAKSSPVDPAYNPVTKTLGPAIRNSSEERSEQPTTSNTPPVASAPLKKTHLVIDTNLSTTSGMTQDQPRSFFDFDSSSDEEEDEPVIRRASSVRVGKAQLISQTQRFMERSALPVSNSGTSLMNKHSIPGGREETLVKLTANATNGSPVLPPPAYEADQRMTLVTEEEIPAMTRESTPDFSVPTPRPIFEICGLTPVVAKAEPSPELRSNVATSSTPVQNGSALRTAMMTQPQLEFNSKTDSNATTLVDGLRSNPLTLSEKRVIQRAISAPLPHRNPNRKVRIRPTDLGVSTIDTTSKPAFRDTFVATPYPKDKVSPVDSNKLLPALISTKTRDRFPSPTRPEILILDLAMERHPTIAHRTIIQIEDKSTFDDEELFKQIKQRLLSLSNTSIARSIVPGTFTSFFNPRKLCHVSPGASSTNLDLDHGLDFIRHLKKPETGYRRKVWTLWLRNHQPTSLSKATGSSFYFQSNKVTNPSDRVEGTMSINTTSSPASTRSTSSISRSGSLRPFFLNTGMTCTQNEKKTANTIQAPKLLFHTKLRGSRILFALVLTMTLSITATVLWVLFGYGSSSPQNITILQSPTPELIDTVLENTTVPQNIFPPSVTVDNYSTPAWRVDAQSRVLPGLVMGMMVFMMTAVLNLVWFWDW